MALNYLCNFYYNILGERKWVESESYDGSADDDDEKLANKEQMHMRICIFFIIPWEWWMNYHAKMTIMYKLESTEKQPVYLDRIVSTSDITRSLSRFLCHRNKVHGPFISSNLYTNLFTTHFYQLLCLPTFWKCSFALETIFT